MCAQYDVRSMYMGGCVTPDIILYRTCKYENSLGGIICEEGTLRISDDGYSAVSWQC